MKGKGKGIADKDCPLQFPDLEPVDHETKCLKYTASKFTNLHVCCIRYNYLDTV